MDDLLNGAPCGFLSLAHDGTILEMNTTLGNMLGYEPSTLQGKPFSTLLAAGGHIFCQTHLFPLLFLQGKAEEIYLSLQSKNGAEVPMLLSAARREQGGIAVNDLAFLPIHQRMRFEEELLQARRAAEEATLEMAQANEREHRIAIQLQQALQPEMPSSVPGLVLTRYFEPALQMSEGVGGDFYDVFALNEGCTALVVGDLSGKGLAAAAQVATVRNMLRAYLYTRPTIAEAVTELNQVLAGNELLTGFTTLFASIYDSTDRTLRYVSCGQEPALIRRAAAGAVEEFGPTGPILGAFAGVLFAEQATTLAPGDALAIFTDGLTEVGETRLSMLGVEGVATILSTPTPSDGLQDAAEMAEELMLRLIAGVDRAAKDGVRDDVCLLVGIAT